MASANLLFHDSAFVKTITIILCCVHMFLCELHGRPVNYAGHFWCFRGLATHSNREQLKWDKIMQMRWNFHMEDKKYQVMSLKIFSLKSFSVLIRFNSNAIFLSLTHQNKINNLLWSLKKSSPCKYKNKINLPCALELAGSEFYFRRWNTLTERSSLKLHKCSMPTSVNCFMLFCRSLVHINMGGYNLGELEYACVSMWTEKEVERQQIKSVCNFFFDLGSCRSSQQITHSVYFRWSNNEGFTVATFFTNFWVLCGKQYLCLSSKWSRHCVW